MKIMSFKLVPRTIVAALLAALGGCAIAPDYTAPAPQLTHTEFTAATSAQPVPSEPFAADFDATWWNIFNDDILVSLERDALAGNLDMGMAAARLAQSRAAAAVSGAALLPSVDVVGSTKRARDSANGPIVALGAPTTPYNLHQYGFDASWEIDLWGRLRKQREMAGAQAAAAGYDVQSLRVLLTAEVARNYLELRGIEQALRISHANLDIARDSLHVIERRRQQGVATTFEWSAAAAQAATVGAEIPALTSRRAALQNALALLSAQPPHALDTVLAGSQSLPQLPARVPVGVPAQLARRRPDIQRAEAQLHAATAAIGVARADFYPSISLTGSFGLEAFHAADLGSWASRQLAVGPVLSLPLFDGGRLKGKLALTEARQQEAAGAFQLTVLKAWHEVDDALLRYRTSQQRAAELGSAVEHNRSALQSANRRYSLGAADYLAVLVTQQRLLDSEQVAARANTEAALALVGLYQSLGGGWEQGGPQ